MVEKTTLKLFLTSGVTLTVGADEKLTINGDECNLLDVYLEVYNAIKDKTTLEFTSVIKHSYKDDEDKVVVQDVTHHYAIPYDRISWFMIEEV